MATLFEELTHSYLAAQYASRERHKNHKRDTTLSGGAIPTAISISNLLDWDHNPVMDPDEVNVEDDQAVMMNAVLINSDDDEHDDLSQRLRKSISWRLVALTHLASKSFIREMHAEVYTLMDTQQVGIRALLYVDRSDEDTTERVSSCEGRSGEEALIPAGFTALGPARCKKSNGYGVCYEINGIGTLGCPIRVFSGWYVDRVYQEHGILKHTCDDKAWTKVKIGDKVRI
ncbi:MAG: hypothetical protein M1827_006039 [Pycnora praestabilis]|nr:MAG: hypothetical protein M1827_006039 [Pycnora praestabilis]